MSNARYLEFDSTYRNRNLWPLPGEFDVLISQSGRKDKDTAVDPISNAVNITSWTSNEFSNDSATISGTISDTIQPISQTGTQQNLVIEFVNPPNIPQTIENYYVGAVIVADSNPVERRRIIATKLLNIQEDISGDIIRLQITVDSAFSSSVVFGQNVTIMDPTDLNDKSNPLIFVPAGRSGSNAYTGCLLYNETRSLTSGTPVYRMINSYDMNTHLLTIDTTTSAVQTNTTGPVDSWLANDKYSIRKEPPILGALNNNIASSNVASLITTFHPEENYFRNSWIRMIDGASAGNMRKIVRYETYTSVAVGGSSTTVQFPYTASSVSGYYNGAYIQIKNDVRQVISYDAVTRTVTVDSNFTSPVVAGDTFTFRSIFVTPNFSNTVGSTDRFEILSFSVDNHNPFVYTGSHVSQQQQVCYEIELLNLSLPNKTLSVGEGRRITFYPYVYVEISNVSGASAGMKNTIYSNNPNSSRMVFRAAIDDVPNPNISSFIKVDGDGMVQTLKFRPNDNLRFSVRLPNGQIYETVESENVGPSPPNPDIQISALFSIRRL
jgi:hypothetical protein